jgi:hypothetical protein
LQRDRLDVFIHDLNLPALRAEGCQCSQAEGRIARPFFRKDGLCHPSKAPEALGDFGIEEEEFHLFWCFLVGTSGMGSINERYRALNCKRLARDESFLAA